MKRIVILVIALISAVTVLGFWGYEKLGGYTPIAIEIIDKKPDNLVGVTYRGTPGNEKLGEIFEKMETQKALHPGSQLHTIYEVEPAGKLDTMLVFVGINQTFSIEGMEVRTFESDRYLLAKISNNSWVMPSPETVKEKMGQYASENKLELSGVFIDVIISDNEVQVIAPIK